MSELSKTGKCLNLKMSGSLKTENVRILQNWKMSESEDVRILQNWKMLESEFARPGNTGEGMNMNVL